MIINNTTIENYTASIANWNTRKSNEYSLTKFVKFLEENKITEVDQDNINTIFRDYQAYLHNKQSRHQHEIST